MPESRCCSLKYKVQITFSDPCSKRPEEQDMKRDEYENERERRERTRKR
jgi:hypothetical protein